MKTLIIIRHAKSNQNFLGNDFERPLNDRGVKDTSAMALRLQQKQPIIDAFISSPAVRAITTAENFATIFEKDINEIILVSALYHATVSTFFNVVENISTELNTVALFSHNPGITYFINDLNCGVSLDNLPTCGIVAVKLYTTNWKEIKNCKKEFLFFDYPKNKQF
jgi:phosphohistidine phosphatase